MSRKKIRQILQTFGDSLGAENSFRIETQPDGSQKLAFDAGLNNQSFDASSFTIYVEDGARFGRRFASDTVGTQYAPGTQYNSPTEWWRPDAYRQSYSLPIEPINTLGGSYKIDPYIAPCDITAFLASWWTISPWFVTIAPDEPLPVPVPGGPVTGPHPGQPGYNPLTADTDEDYHLFFLPELNRTVLTNAYYLYDSYDRVTGVNLSWDQNTDTNLSLSVQGQETIDGPVPAEDGDSPNPDGETYPLWPGNVIWDPGLPVGTLVTFPGGPISIGRPTPYTTTIPQGGTNPPPMPPGPNGPPHPNPPPPPWERPDPSGVPSGVSGIMTKFYPGYGISNCYTGAEEVANYPGIPIPRPGVWYVTGWVQVSGVSGQRFTSVSTINGAIQENTLAWSQAHDNGMAYVPIEGIISIPGATFPWINPPTDPDMRLQGAAKCASWNFQISSPDGNTYSTSPWGGRRFVAVGMYDTYIPHINISIIKLSNFEALGGETSAASSINL